MMDDFNMMIWSGVIAIVAGIGIGVFKEVPQYGYPENAQYPPSQCYEDKGSLRCDNGPQDQVRLNNPKWEIK